MKYEIIRSNKYQYACQKPFSHFGCGGCTMVSPQVNELYMLVEWLSKTQEELRTHVNAEIPEISKLNMQIQFIEERLIDVEMLIDKIRQNGISHD